MVTIRSKALFELTYKLYFLLDSGRFSTEKEANGLRFFALLTVGADAVRTAFDGIYPSFENKLNNFIQQCSSKTKFKDAISCNNFFKKINQLVQVKHLEKNC